MTAIISTAEPITMVTQLSFIIASFKQKKSGLPCRIPAVSPAASPDLICTGRLVAWKGFLHK
ncbi:hypothetical protein [Paraburkholderia sp.]|uniref:hypothetical protein n=1 Tax=Paraburkholderia sp. TaxID=1926495 RepID=UPI00257DF1A0|nr:hypothetical protein [Paraburkholderia sp.]